jgi:hypothetical protein
MEQLRAPKGQPNGGQWVGSGGGPGGKVTGQSWDRRQKGMFKINKKLDSISKGGYIQGNMNAEGTRTQQISKDPDAERIAAKGKLSKVKGRGGNAAKMGEPQLGTDGQCHWNTGKLYEEGKIDSVVIGFAKGSQGWHQHTWGMKKGKIIETTASNLRDNEHYFGLELSPVESTAFSLWVKGNPPGQGVGVRFVEWSQD